MNKDSGVKVGKELMAGSNTDEDWDGITGALTEIMKTKNPGGKWHAEVKNFGWMKRSGYLDLQANDGATFLSKILPDTDCTFKIYDYGTDGIAINNMHHDSPTGDEWYYITPQKEEVEESVHRPKYKGDEGVKVYKDRKGDKETLTVYKDGKYAGMFLTFTEVEKEFGKDYEIYDGLGESKTGTSNFVTKAMAYKYYEGQGYDKAAVDQKFKEGAISVGEPKVKPGQKISINRAEGRYEIIDESKLNETKVTKPIYVANCIEDGERFISLFQSNETNKEKLWDIGQELASGWGAECISVTKFKPKSVKVAIMHDVMKNTTVELTLRQYQNWIKKHPTSTRYDYTKTEYRTDTEPTPTDVWDADISSEENLKDFKPPTGPVPVNPVQEAKIVEGLEKHIDLVLQKAGVKAEWEPGYAPGTQKFVLKCDKNDAEAIKDALDASGDFGEMSWVDDLGGLVIGPHKSFIKEDADQDEGEPPVAGKVGVKSIWLNRGEGPSAEVGKPVTVGSYAEANKILHRWAQTAPKEGGGYDKVDFKVTFQDGEEYEGRLDIKHPTAKNNDLDVARHVRDYIKFYTGSSKPGWMKDEQYAASMKGVNFDDYKAFLQKYDLGESKVNERTLDCPYCEQEFDDDELYKGKCPHCGKNVTKLSNEVKKKLNIPESKINEVFPRGNEDAPSEAEEQAAQDKHYKAQDDDLVARAVKFLKNPKAQGTVAMKIEFLKHKGLTDQQITSALDQASGGEVVKTALPDIVGESKKLMEGERYNSETFALSIDKPVALDAVVSNPKQYLKAKDGVKPEDFDKDIKSFIEVANRWKGSYAFKNVQAYGPNFDEIIPTHATKIKETLETPTALKIMAIDSAILKKYKHQSGIELAKHQDEFIANLKKAGIESITQEDADALEDNNFHTALEILMNLKMVKSKKLKEEKGMEKDIETMYATVLEAVPELKDFDPEEVKKGLGDEQEHKDILSQDEKEQVVQIGKIVLAHLKECPKYYAVLDAALEQFEEEGASKEVEHEAGETAAEEEAEHKPGGEEDKKLPVSDPVTEAKKMGLEEFLGAEGYDVEPYSGRGMYGSECVGVVVEQEEVDELERKVIVAAERGKIQDPGSARTDNMGMKMVVYYPRVKMVANENKTVSESIKAIRKAKIQEALVREEKTEQIEQLTEAFNKIEENYINDVYELTEKVRLAEENKKTSKEDEEKFMKLEKELEDLKKVNKKYQEENDEFNKKIGGLESNVADKDLELKKVKESCENQLKEMRVQIVAKITGLTLDEKMVSLLKECKDDDELLQKLEGYRTKLAEAVLHSNIVKKVELVQPIPVSSPKQAGLDKFGKLVESMM